SHETFQVTKVRGNRLWRPREAPVGLEVDRVHLAAEPLEQFGYDHAARTMRAVERHAKLPPANRIDFDERQREHRGEMLLDRLLVDPHLPKQIPRRARKRALDYAAHLHPFSSIQEQSARPDELERVPFDRIVTGRDRQPARGVMMLDRELNRWRGRESDVDHIATNRLQRRERRAMKHRSGHTRVASAHDATCRRGVWRRGPFAVCPRAEAGREPRHHFRRERFAYAPAHPGHANHQAFVHAVTSVTVHEKVRERFDQMITTWTKRRGGRES